MWKDKSSIQTKFLNKMVFIVFISIALWCFIWIQGEYSAFMSESESMRSEYINSQKLKLKKEVAHVVKDISVMKSQAEQKLESTLKERVYEAHEIAMNIYQQNVDSKSLVEIKKMIKDALRPIRFFDKRGYYFAVSMDGVEQLYPVRPEFEGKSLIGLQDSKGSFIIQDEIELIKKSGEGFITSYWNKPDKDLSRQFPQITFIKYFKPLNWYFGTGDYLDAFVAQSQKEIISHIVNLRFGTEGYLFGSTYQGDSLFSNGKITMGNNNIWNLTDPNGVKIIQEQRKAVENPEGGFVDYSWNKLNTSVLSPKASFVQGVPGWEWMIGAGVYLDTIEKNISYNKIVLQNKLKKNIIQSIFILAMLLCLVYFWSRRISDQIQKSVNTFSSFMGKASTDSIAININDLELKEFRDIAVSTNKMLADRKQAEEALQKEKATLYTIFENNPHGIAVVNEKGKYLFINQMFTKITGYTLQEIKVGREWFQKAYPDLKYRETVIDAWGKNRLKENMDKDYCFNITCKNGKIKSIAFRTTYLEGYSISVLTDISARKQAERALQESETKLQQAQKMESIGTLAGGIAHDFNNILFPIVGHSEMMLEDIPENSPFRNGLNQIYTSALRASELVKQILTFSRQDSCDLKLIKMQPVIKEALKLIRSTIPTTITIKQNIQTDCGPIKADPTQIHQIIMNLSTNAYHAMEETGGELNIRLKEVIFGELDLFDPDIKPQKYACLSISDTGKGMDKVTIKKIFDPFFTTKETGKGTGMGLSVVHGIVKSMNGTITVDSRSDNGTEFHIYLPVFQNLSEKQEPQAEKPIQTGTERILLVDDEESIVTMEKNMLERIGYQVTSCTSSIEALEVFRVSFDKFDIIITDMQMPNMSGDKLAGELTKVRPDIPILLCTGFSETMSEKKAESLGINGFFLKPVVMTDLAHKIREVLDKNYT